MFMKRIKRKLTEDYLIRIIGLGFLIIYFMETIGKHTDMGKKIW